MATLLGSATGSSRCRLSEVRLRQLSRFTYFASVSVLAKVARMFPYPTLRKNYHILFDLFYSGHVSREDHIPSKACTMFKCISDSKRYRE